MNPKQILYVLLLVFLFSIPAGASSRTALVIGNASYIKSPLKNPANDARDMAAMLEECGFNVTLKINSDFRTMGKAIKQFGNDLRAGGVGLFYFAGHGLQVKNNNYLIPIGATIESEGDVRYGAVSARLILSRMEDAGNEMNIVILDACRNNPFVRSFRSPVEGLARMDAPTGSLIAYATAPGSLAADGRGRNGIYTKHLIKNIKVPGLTIEQVLKNVRISVLSETHSKQTPWEASSLTGDFYFNTDRNPIPRPESGHWANDKLHKAYEKLAQEQWELESFQATIVQKKKQEQERILAVRQKTEDLKQRQQALADLVEQIVREEKKKQSDAIQMIEGMEKTAVQKEEELKWMQASLAREADLEKQNQKIMEKERIEAQKQLEAKRRIEEQKRREEQKKIEEQKRIEAQKRLEEQKRIQEQKRIEEEKIAAAKAEELKQQQAALALKMARLKKEKKEREVAEKKKIESDLKIAKTHIKAGRIVRPRKENAFEIYEKMQTQKNSFGLEKSLEGLETLLAIGYDHLEKNGFEIATVIFNRLKTTTNGTIRKKAIDAEQKLGKAWLKAAVKLMNNNECQKSLLYISHAGKILPRDPAVRIARDRVKTKTGWLNIYSEPWANIIIDGRDIQRTSPANRIELICGQHQVKLLNPGDKRYSIRQAKILIQAGGTTRLVAIQDNIKEINDK